MISVGAKDFQVILMTADGENGDSGEVAHLKGFGAYHTMCGWCDVIEEDDSKLMSEVDVPLCVECISAVRQARTFTRTMVVT